MLVKRADAREESRREFRRALGAMKVAEPLVRALIRRPGLEADQRDVGRSFGILAMRTRSLSEKLWAELKARGAAEGHPSELIRLAQHAAWHVADHWIRRADLDERELLRLLSEAADHVGGELSGEALEDPGYRERLPRSVEWQLSWLRAAMTVAGAVANGTSTLGHDPGELRDRIYTHMRRTVSEWSGDFGVEGDERLVVEQSLMRIVAGQYAALWLREIDHVRMRFRRMSEEERQEAGRRGHDLDHYFKTVEQVIGQLRESGAVIEQAFEEARLRDA